MKASVPCATSDSAESSSYSTSSSPASSLSGSPSSVACLDSGAALVVAWLILEGEGGKRRCSEATKRDACGGDLARPSGKLTTANTKKNELVINFGRGAPGGYTCEKVQRLILPTTYNPFTSYMITSTLTLRTGSLARQ